MMKFSANLGFLWTDLSLPEGIRAAKAAGFDATYATEINAGCIHVMAGFTDGSDKAEETFRDNLKYACSKTDKTILIEPLNTKDAPGYHLTRLDHALTIVDELDLENLKIMFDCYHMEIMEGDLALIKEKSTSKPCSKPLPIWVGRRRWAQNTSQDAPPKRGLDGSQAIDKSRIALNLLDREIHLS